MTDRPILFSAPMVRALLDGRKTQTRRVIRNVRQDNSITIRKPTKKKMGTCTHVIDACEFPQLLPIRAKAGDRLWVREAHYLTDDGDSEYAVFAEDEASVAAHIEDMHKIMASHPSIDWSRHLRWRPSIHMPRWASRLTLTVTDVRVQRLREISEEDAIAEGLEVVGNFPRTQYRDYSRTVVGTGVPQLSFMTLWDSLNAKRAPWDSNPWIAAYTFTTEKRNVDHD